MEKNKKDIKQDRLFGVVAKYINDKGYGFIKCENTDRSYFVHVSQIQDRILNKGYLVNFKVGMNKKTGKEQAMDVIVVDSSSRRKKI